MKLLVFFLLLVSFSLTKSKKLLLETKDDQMEPAMKQTTSRKDGGNDYWDDSGFGRKISDNKMSDKQVSDLISNLIRRINRRKQATNEDLKSEVSRW